MTDNALEAFYSGDRVLFTHIPIQHIVVMRVPDNTPASIKEWVEALLADGNMTIGLISRKQKRNAQ